MQYIGYIISALITAVVFNGIFVLLHKPSKSDGNMVKLPLFTLIVGIICAVFFLILTVIVLNLNDFIWAAFIFLAFSLLGASLILAYINCRIMYNETEFTAKSFCGVKHTYTYDEITGIHGKNMDVKLYIGKRVIRIDGFSIGKDEFLRFAEKQYRKFNNGKSIPKVVSKTDIFNGNVENSGEFIFVYVLVGIICIGAIVFFSIVSAPKTDKDLEYKSLSVVRYEVQENDLLLYENDNSMFFKIPAYKELLKDADEFLMLCDNGISFYIGFIENTRSDDPYYEMYSIIVNDKTVYLTIEDVHEYYYGNAWQFYLLIGGLTAVWLVFVVLSIYVGRHPEKFSERFIRLFFKDGYVHIS